MRAGGGHAHISMAFGRGEALALFKGALFIGPQTPRPTRAAASIDSRATRTSTRARRGD